MSRKKRKEIKFEESSGNIFADLGLEDSGELYARAQIGVHAFKTLKDKKLKQREIAGVLGIAQPDVSHLMNGHFRRVGNPFVRRGGAACFAVLCEACGL